MLSFSAFYAALCLGVVTISLVSFFINFWRLGDIIYRPLFVYIYPFLFNVQGRGFDVASAIICAARGDPAYLEETRDEGTGELMFKEAGGGIPERSRY